MTGDDSDRRVNLHKYIRNLVLEGHMSYEAVLDLTTYQIAALLTEDSLPPGEIDPATYLRIMGE